VAVDTAAVVEMVGADIVAVVVVDIVVEIVAEAGADTAAEVKVEVEVGKFEKVVMEFVGFG